MKYTNALKSSNVVSSQDRQLQLTFRCFIDFMKKSLEPDDPRVDKLEKMCRAFSIRLAIWITYFRIRGVIII